MIFGSGDCFFDRNALCSGNRRPSGSVGIAGNHEVVGDGAALNVIFGAPWSVGIDLAFFVAVFLRVAVDEHGGRAFALRGEGFESAIAVGIRVADEHDLAFDADAVLAEQVVVFGIAAVRVDDGSGDFSGDRHADPGAGYGGIFRVIVAGEWGFAKQARDSALGAIISSEADFGFVP